MSSSTKPRLRIEYLDGLRGVAALYVVVFHTFLFFYHGPVALRTHLPPLLLTLWKRLFFLVFHLGHDAVVVFIVLSGYVLMLPVTRTPNGTLPNGIADYVKRRARRILPPYYAALAFSLLIIFCIPGMNQKFNSTWDQSVPIDNWKTIIAHLFLVHNYHGWAEQIDPPMWSIAVEWQIYFWFALFLLPLWRRLGLWKTLFIAWILGPIGYYTPHLAGTNLWLLGDFACGMAAALIGFWPAPILRQLQESYPWYRLSALFAGVAYLLLIAHEFIKATLFQKHPALKFLKVFNILWLPLGTGWEWPTDLLVGLATACFIVASTQRLQKGYPDNLPLKLLHHRMVVGLGAFSYSLYLVHFPILALFDHFGRLLHLSGWSYFLALFGIAIPACVGVAYLFFLVFERPFLPTHLRQGQAVSLERREAS